MQEQKKILQHRATVTNDAGQEALDPKPRGGAERSQCIIMSHNEVCMCQTERQ